MVMFILIIGGLIVFLNIVTIIQEKISFDVKSFFAKTMPLDRGIFGVYCFTGKQGSGKTYSTTKFILNNYSTHPKLYSNITLRGVVYTPIRDVEHLLSLRFEKDCVIVFDEIFTIMQKDTRMGREIMEFLAQQRKMKNIMITTAQEWLELPLTYRRFVRIQISCETKPLGRFGGILKEIYHDAYNMYYDNLVGEYVAPTIDTKFSKYERRVMMSYNTDERIYGQELPGARVSRSRPRTTATAAAGS